MNAQQNNAFFHQVPWFSLSLSLSLSLYRGLYYTRDMPIVNSAVKVIGNW